MTGIIIKFTIGLFILLVLPALMFPPKEKNKKQIRLFINISCKIIGSAIIIFAGIDLIRFLMNFK